MDNISSIQAVQLPPRIYNIKAWIKTVEAEVLRSTFDNMLHSSGFKVLNYSGHRFPLNGFTALWLLAESHLALHTFTGSGWTYVELSSCNRLKALNFINLCENDRFEWRWEQGLKEVNCEKPEAAIG